jgi:NAD(P)-dependent dehydrogenase (short-subunit alcohol dehydrogenase family)
LLFALGEHVEREILEESPNMLLGGKTCLITGGGTGIGRATAFRFGEEGASVWIAGVTREPLEGTAREIGPKCEWRICDVTKQAQIQRVIDNIPHLDIVVANAAVSYSIDLLSDRIIRWREMMEVNMWGAVFTCRAAGRKMIRQGGGGRIIIISSILSGIAEPGSTHYAMAKAALNQLGRQLAIEWAEYGILVNVIAPGCVDTPMSCVSGSNEFEAEWFKKFFIDPKHPRIPLMRPGEPEEIAEAILFFANPRNSYCTGSLLIVDGGLTAKF